jgi:hypothetical protein
VVESLPQNDSGKNVALPPSMLLSK